MQVLVAAGGMQTGLVTAGGRAASGDSTIVSALLRRQSAGSSLKISMIKGDADIRWNLDFLCGIPELR